MGLLEKILPKAKKDVRGTVFKTVSESSPVFVPFSGNVYEQELTRASIDRFATWCSKLKPEVQGTAKPAVRKAFETSPNPWETWPQFLYRLATILEIDTTAFVVPVLDDDMETVRGLSIMYCLNAETLEYKGVPWIRFNLASGDTPCLPLDEVCIVNRFQYRSDFFGEPNCLKPTMQLIDAQNQAQKAAIKNGAKIQFIGSLTGQVREEDMKAKRDRFVADNLRDENNGGLMLYDQTFADIKQVEPKSYVIDPDEMERVEKSVFNYFGTNEDILQNKFTEDTWGAYYEGRIEPFAVQLGEGLSHMLYTPRERANNKVSFSANRLEYASNASKRNMIRDMMDRGVFTLNEAREVLQLPPVEGGDVRVIRGEYMNADTMAEGIGEYQRPHVDTDGKDVDEEYAGGDSLPADYDSVNSKGV